MSFCPSCPRVAGRPEGRAASTNRLGLISVSSSQFPRSHIIMIIITMIIIVLMIIIMMVIYY